MRSFLFMLAVTLVGCNYQQPRVGSRPPTVIFPEEISEARLGDPLFVDYVSADTVSLAFDPMKDRLFWVRNPYCKSHTCKANLIWVDLEGLSIYIEEGHAEMVDFKDEVHLIQNLYWIMDELAAGKHFDKTTGSFK
jgi:hypothetical protein